MLPTAKELDQMKQIDIRNVDKNTLIDLADITIDGNSSAKDRVLKYMEDVFNPYFIRIGDYAVKFTYAVSGETMEERMMAYVEALSQAELLESSGKDTESERIQQCSHVSSSIQG